MADNTQLPNGFTGFAFRKPAGGTSAADAIREREAQRAAHAGQPAPAQAPRRGGVNGFLTEREAASDAANEVRGAFQYNRDHEEAAAYSADGENPEGRVEFDPEKLATIPEKDRRWAWLEIDLNAIRHNASAVKKMIGSGRHMMAVVKADAYGHGAVRVAKTALNSGADYLGVATVDEGIKLREGLVNAPILMLAEPPASAIPLLLAYKIMPAVYSPEFAIKYAEAADSMGLRAPYHLAINTGMNRIGVRWDEVVNFMHQIGFHRALELEGVFTHFATADCPETLDFHIQAKRYIEAVEGLRAAGINPGIVHCANSAAAIRYPDVRFDMVRLGIGLYGYQPCPETTPLIELRPAMSVHARITDTRLVPMSEGVSYGLNYRSPGSVKICTVPVGYGDGLRRGLSSRTDFLVDGV
ncbi:alanine racemase, partial [uncultured Senegalimassilia sp.]|uniref:alanine racemase n=1 Tax=uncultured Senegalimassilia sp. TaxID=1714350 RepID=UPI0025E00D76